MIVEYAKRIYPPSSGSPAEQCRRRARTLEDCALEDLRRWWDVDGQRAVRRDRREARRLRTLAAELEFQADWNDATPAEQRLILRGCY